MTGHLNKSFVFALEGTKIKYVHDPSYITSVDNGSLVVPYVTKYIYGS